MYSFNFDCCNYLITYDLENTILLKNFVEMTDESDDDYDEQLSPESKTHYAIKDKKMEASMSPQAKNSPDDHQIRNKSGSLLKSSTLDIYSNLYKNDHSSNLLNKLDAPSNLSNNSYKIDPQNFQRQKINGNSTILR